MSDLTEHRRKASQTLGAYCLPGPEMIALLDEIERLRALLRPFVDMAAEPEDFAAARRALEGK